MKKIDYAIGALVGFFSGIFVLPTLYNLGIRDAALLLALPWVTAALWLVGAAIGGFLSKRLAVLAQFVRFVEVGLLNTTIDFGVLNILSRLSGITAGLIIGGVNVPGFLVAVTNSYFWNKLWVFRDRGNGEPLLGDFPEFFAVTVGGVLLNSGIVIILTTYVPPQFGFGAGAWLNFSKAAATALTLFWNFTGYKFVVFRPERRAQMPLL